MLPRATSRPLLFSISWEMETPYASSPRRISARSTISSNSPRYASLGICSTIQKKSNGGQDFRSPVSSQKRWPILPLWRPALFQSVTHAWPQLAIPAALYVRAGCSETAQLSLQLCDGSGMGLLPRFTNSRTSATERTWQRGLVAVTQACRKETEHQAKEQLAWLNRTHRIVLKLRFSGHGEFPRQRSSHVHIEVPSHFKQATWSDSQSSSPIRHAIAGTRGSPSLMGSLREK